MYGVPPYPLGRTSINYYVVLFDTLWPPKMLLLLWYLALKQLPFIYLDMCHWVRLRRYRHTTAQIPIRSIHIVLGHPRILGWAIRSLSARWCFLYGKFPRNRWFWNLCINEGAYQGHEDLRWYLRVSGNSFENFQRSVGSDENVNTDVFFRSH